MFSHRLKQLRSDRDVTQTELAKLLNLSQSTIAYYESGRKMPTLENAVIIAKFFNTSLDYLVGLTNNCSKPVPNKPYAKECSDISLLDIYDLSNDSLKELEYFVNYLKYRNQHKKKCEGKE